MSEIENMATQPTHHIIIERLRSNPAIVAVSGPSGAGKDYLTDRARESFAERGIPFYGVQMVTERPSRGAVETKKCITPEEYDRLVEEGRLIGDHVNKVRYGYLLEDIESALNQSSESGGIVVIELNPTKQREFPQELDQKLGRRLTTWVGVQTTEEQTRTNMRERGEAETEIEIRISIMNEFFDSMRENPMIRVVDNGPENRANSATDFIVIIEQSILETE